MKISSKDLKIGILSGLGQGIYCLLIGWLFLNLEKIFGAVDTPSILLPAIFLLIFVFSAVISGLIVLGYPGYLAVQKQYRQAVQILIVTLLTIFVLLAFGFLGYSLLIQ